MNIYEKLQTMRVEMQREPIKKSGKNTFAKYNYFELGDFLPRINELMLAHRVCSAISYAADTAVMTMTNIDEPDERIVFMTPMSSADLKGCHAVQNLGAVQTYIRRYLYMTAFEIVEHDALDATTGEDANDEGPVTAAQLNTLYLIANTRGYDEKAVALLVNKKMGCAVNAMTKQQFNEILGGYMRLPEVAS